MSARAALYFIAGSLVGFLCFGEFALLIFPLVRVALLLLALAGVAGVVLGKRDLELWPVFIAAAMVFPLTIDSHVVGLPRCDNVPSGIACLGGTRDVTSQFQMEIVIAMVAALGVIALIVRETRRIIDVGR